MDLSREEKIRLIKMIEFGQRIAEEETDLEKYFVETHQWDMVFSGKADIVKGAKGAGKSALYMLLNKKADDLERRGIIAISGENPRGTTAFRDIATNPVLSEVEFITLWKIYILQLIGRKFESFTEKNSHSKKLVSSLKDNSLLPDTNILKNLVRTARSFVSRFSSMKEVELSVEVNGIDSSAKPTLNFTLGDTKEKVIENIDDLFYEAQEALVSFDKKVWVMFDRLDVAFPDHPDLERNALRALFKVYGDMRSHSNIEMKIFIRNDIWDRIFESGYREASHLTKDISIEWNKTTILNLIVKRVLLSDEFIVSNNLNRDEILNSISEQEKVFLSLI